MIKNYSDGTSAVTLGPGATAISQGPVVRMTATYDASIGALIEHAERAQETIFYNPQRRSASLQSIPQDALVVQMKREVKQAHGLNTFYGTTQAPSNFIETFSNIAGVPAVPVGVSLIGKNKKMAAKTAILDSVTPIGVSARGMQVGTATPTPISNGFPVDAQVHKTMILPMDARPDLFKPQKLSVYTGNDPAYDGRFTLEPITAQSLTKAMTSNITIYEEAVEAGDTDLSMKNIYNHGGLRPYSGDGVPRFNRRYENGSKAKFGALGLLLRMLKQLDENATIKDAQKMVIAMLTEDSKKSSNSKGSNGGGGGGSANTSESVSEQDKEAINAFVGSLKTTMDYPEGTELKLENFKSLVLQFLQNFVIVKITSGPEVAAADRTFELILLQLDSLKLGTPQAVSIPGGLADIYNAFLGNIAAISNKMTAADQEAGKTFVFERFKEMFLSDTYVTSVPTGMKLYGGFVTIGSGSSSSKLQIKLFEDDSDMLIDTDIETTAATHGFSMLVEACAEEMLHNKPIAVFTAYRTNETDGMRDQNNCYETLDTLVQIF